MGERCEGGFGEQFTDIDVIVLAGGKGLRLGRDKAAETFGDRSLLERVISRLAWLDSEIIIVTADEPVELRVGDSSRLRVVADIFPEKGPLGGIYTGLSASDNLHSLVVACDMPLLNQSLLRYMVGLASGFDLVVPRLGSMVEPLHAVYSRACLAPVEDLLKQGELQVRRLFEMVRVRYVEADEIDRFAPRHLSFFNINTEADLEKARKLVGGDDITLDDKCRASIG